MSVVSTDHHLVSESRDRDVSGTVTAILQTIDINFEMSNMKEVEEGFRSLRELSHHAACAEAIAQHLAVTKRPFHYLEAIRDIFSMQSAEAVLELVRSLLSCEANDAQFCMLLETISDLPLERLSTDLLFRALRSALASFAAELDGSLLKVTFKVASLTVRLVSLWVERVRSREVEELVDLAEALLYSKANNTERFVCEWMEQLSQRLLMDASNNLKLASRADACVLLVAVSGSVGRVAEQRGRALLMQMHRHAVVPYSSLVAICRAAVGGRTQPWARLLGAVWTVCQLLTDSLTERSPAAEDRNATAALVVNAGLKDLLGALFQQAVIMREGICKTLLSEVFPQARGLVAGMEPLRRTQTSAATQKPIIPQLPPLGQSLAASSECASREVEVGIGRSSRLQRRHARRSNALQRQYRFRRASVAVELLAALCALPREVGCAARDIVLKALFRRIDQQLAEGWKVFPSPAVFMRLLACCLRDLEIGNSENDVMIKVQKHLGAPVLTATSLFRSLFCKSASGRSIIGAAGAQQARLMSKVPASLPVQLYSATTLGVMLAGQLALNATFSPTHASGQQPTVLLEFLLRHSDAVVEDVSGLYLLDVLCQATARLDQDHPGRGAGTPQQLVLLEKFLARCVKAFGLTYRPTDAQHTHSSGNIYTVQLVGGPSGGENSPRFGWEVAELCAKLTDSVASCYDAAPTMSAADIRYTELQTREACFALYHLCERVSFAKMLLRHSEAQTATFTALGGGGGGRQLSAEQSQLMLMGWLAPAAEAFYGEFVLPINDLDVDQAMRMAWERGLLVAISAGRIAAASLTAGDINYGVLDGNEVLALVCQVHNCRSLLRAAHANYISTKHRGEGSPRGSPAPPAVGAKRGRTAARVGSRENRVVGSQGATPQRWGKAKAKSPSPTKRSTTNIKAEIASDLQFVQRTALQRLLRKTMVAVPPALLWSALEAVLTDATLAPPSAPRTLPEQHMPAGLLTSTGLALVAQLAYSLARPAADATQGADACDSFVPVRGLHRAPELSVSEMNRQKKVVQMVLRALPPLLDWVEHQRRNPGRNEPHNTKKLGFVLDRDGCKVLLLNVLHLMESTVDFWVGTNMQEEALEQFRAVSDAWDAYDAVAEAAAPLSTIPVATEDVPNTSSNSGVGGANAAVHERCHCVATMYNALEKRILRQTDCTLTTVGLRCLQRLLDASSRGAQAERASSVSWKSFCNLYTEGTNLSVHLHLNAVHGEDVPGMDENWSCLAHLVSSQPALHDVLQEVERRTDKRTHVVVKMLQGTFSTHRDFHAPGKTADLRGELSVPAYRQMWLCWWAAEEPSERVYGVAMLLRRVFKTQLEEPAQTSKSADKRSTGNKFKGDIKKHRRSPAAAGGTDSSASDSEESADMPVPAAKRRMLSSGAVEQLLNRSPIARAPPRVFEFLTEETVNFHMEIALPLLPALFLLSEPCVPNGNGSMRRAASPYENFIHVSMLQLWVLERSMRILTDQHDHLHWFLSVLPLLTKVLRAVLPAVDGAVARATEWRVTQPTPAVGSGAADPGAVGLFSTMVGWAYQVAHSIRGFAEEFKTSIIDQGTITVTPALVREVPGLIKRAEHLQSRLGGVARANGFGIPSASALSARSTGAGRPGEIGDEGMYTHMMQFRARHDIALAPLRAEVLALTAIAAAQTASSAAMAGASTLDSDTALAVDDAAQEYNRLDGYASDGFGSDEEFEFAALTGGAGSSGWGLYSPEGQEDSSSQPTGTPTSGMYSTQDGQEDEDALSDRDGKVLELEQFEIDFDEVV